MNKEQTTFETATGKFPQKIKYPAAFFSLVVPGLGQLLQKRWREACIFLILFILSVLPVFYCLYFYIFSVIPDESFHDFAPFLILFPFPILTLFFAVLDAACSRQENPFPLAFQVKWLSIVFILFHAAFFLTAPMISTARNAARRMECTNHLKQIMNAFQAYHDAFGSFPPLYTVDEKGEPLHSWRVLLLPYLDQEELYHKIHLNEPWNSEYNHQFHHLNIPVWQCASHRKFQNILRKQIPSLSTDANCCYSVIVGPDAAFSFEKPRSLSDFYKGISNTPFIAERLIPVCWMDPTNEISSEMAKEGINQNLYGLGSCHVGGCNMAFADGSVRFISVIIDPKLLREILTCVKDNPEK